MDERRPPLTMPSVTPATLPPRQREVAALVAAGLTNAEIGRRLALADSTVAEHVDQALRTLNQHSRLRLAVWSSAHGLVVTPACAAGADTADTAEAAF